MRETVCDRRSPTPACSMDPGRKIARALRVISPQGCVGYRLSSPWIVTCLLPLRMATAAGDRRAGHDLFVSHLSEAPNTPTGTRVCYEAVRDVQNIGLFVMTADSQATPVS